MAAEALLLFDLSDHTMSTLTSTPTGSTVPDSTARLGNDDAGGAERLEKQLFVALFGGVLLLAAWVSHLFGIEGTVSNIPALIGDTAVTKVWPTPAKQVAWVALGSAGWKQSGQTTMENGLPVKGGMPAWATSLKPDEIMAVVLHERATLDGEEFDAAKWEQDFKATMEEFVPDQAAAYEKVLEEWKTTPPA